MRKYLFVSSVFSRPKFQYNASFIMHNPNGFLTLGPWGGREGAKPTESR